MMVSAILVRDQEPKRSLTVVLDSNIYNDSIYFWLASMLTVKCLQEILINVGLSGCQNLQAKKYYLTKVKFLSLQGAVSSIIYLE